jgi:hypothetical protein
MADQARPQAGNILTASAAGRAVYANLPATLGPISTDLSAQAEFHRLATRQPLRGWKIATTTKDMQGVGSSSLRRGHLQSRIHRSPADARRLRQPEAGMRLAFRLGRPAAGPSILRCRPDAGGDSIIPAFSWPTTAMPSIATHRPGADRRQCLERGIVLGGRPLSAIPLDDLSGSLEIGVTRAGGKPTGPWRRWPGCQSTAKLETDFAAAWLS